VTLGAANSIRLRFAQCWRAYDPVNLARIARDSRRILGLPQTYNSSLATQGERVVVFYSHAALSTGLKDCSQIFGLFFPEPR
jgi:hypothetical protein